MKRSELSAPETDAMQGCNDPAQGPPEAAAFRLEVEAVKAYATNCSECGKDLGKGSLQENPGLRRNRKSNAITCSLRCRLTRWRRAHGANQAYRTGRPRGADTSSTKHNPAAGE
jgi:hypothetical protein